MLRGQRALRYRAATILAVLVVGGAAIVRCSMGFPEDVEIVIAGRGLRPGAPFLVHFQGHKSWRSGDRRLVIVGADEVGVISDRRNPFLRGLVDSSVVLIAGDRSYEMGERPRAPGEEALFLIGAFSGDPNGSVRMCFGWFEQLESLGTSEIRREKGR